VGVAHRPVPALQNRRGSMDAPYASSCLPPTGELPCQCHEHFVERATMHVARGVVGSDVYRPSQLMNPARVAENLCLRACQE
jgi:hypothetical protein